MSNETQIPPKIKLELNGKANAHFENWLSLSIIYDIVGLDPRAKTLQDREFAAKRILSNPSTYGMVLIDWAKSWIEGFITIWAEHCEFDEDDGIHALCYIIEVRAKERFKDEAPN